MGVPDSKWKRAAGVVEEIWPSVISALGAILLSVAPIWLGTPNLTVETFLQSNPGRVIVLSIILALVGAWVSGVRTLRAGKLSRENETLRTAYTEAVEGFDTAFREIVRSHLVALAHELQLSDKERISVYVHNGVDAFEMVGRYSKNPEFNKAARTKYPDSEGCIALAWRNGFAYAANLPDPVVDCKAYQDVLLNQYNIPRKTSKAMRMKGRCIAACACEGSSGARIGVIVAESAQPTALSEDRARLVLESRSVRHITLAIEILGSFEPDLAYARQEGY
jgi:hypothetical protein